MIAQMKKGRIIKRDKLRDFLHPLFEEKEKINSEKKSLFTKVWGIGLSVYYAIGVFWCAWIHLSEHIEEQNRLVLASRCPIRPPDS